MNCNFLNEKLKPKEYIFFVVIKKKNSTVNFNDDSTDIEFLPDLRIAIANCYWKLKGLKSQDIGDKQRQIRTYLLYLRWTWEANLHTETTSAASIVQGGESNHTIISHFHSYLRTGMRYSFIIN